MVKANLESVRARISTAAQSVGRDPSEITLVCVTKGVEVDRIQQAVAAGAVEIGENRVQEAQAKKPLLEKFPLRWHLVGHLQRNKGKFAVDLFDVIHSVDSLELVEVLERQAALRKAPGGQRIEAMIQVNVSGKAAQHGCKLEETLTLAQRLIHSGHLKFLGLMTLAPWTDNPEDARPVFRKIRQLRDRLQEKVSSAPLHLSMGMSHDFEVAVQEGATVVRIGAAIFGASG